MSGLNYIAAWATSDGGRTSFDACPAGDSPARTGHDATMVITNDLAVMEGLTGAGKLAAISDIYYLAFPASGAENVTQMMAEQKVAPAASGAALWQLWQQAATRLAALPLWSLELMAILLEGADEPALARICNAFAGQARAAGRGDGKWSDTFAPPATRNGQGLNGNTAGYTPLTPQKLAAMADSGGALSRNMPGHEPRPGQLNMISAVAEAFNDSKHLLVEAGTGVGKSMGYLIPATAWATLNNTPVVVSTNTRNLQTQLVEKDIPLLRAALGAESSNNLRTVLLKGRANYLCLRRLGLLVSDTHTGLDRADLRQFARALSWATQTADGDLDAYSGGSGVDPVFTATLGSHSEECPWRSCRHYRNCFVRRVREQAAQAHVVVANHALAFADAGEQGNNILPPYRHLVFDEAHNLEESATRHFSTEISPNRLRLLLRRISAEQHGRATGIIANIKKHLGGGAMADTPLSRGLRRLLNDAQAAVIGLRERGNAFFEALANAMEETEDVCRIRGFAPLPPRASVLEPGTPETTAAHRLQQPVIATEIRHKGAFREWNAQGGRDAVHESALAFNDSLHRMHLLLKGIAEGLMTMMEGELGLHADQSADVAGAARMIDALAADMRLALAAQAPEYVFWIEMARPGDTAAGKRQPRKTAALFAAPLNVGAFLHRQLYAEKASVIFCSATLRVNNSFEFIGKRLGLDLITAGRLGVCLAGSPFDYARQTCIMATPFLPDPRTGAETAAYVEQLSALMLELFTVMKGRSLALFTSYQMMRQCAALLEQPLAEAGIRLLMQARGTSRDQITRTFRAGGATVLFGAQSFWEGVDVVGEALSCVVIARLPFMAVGEPVFEARCEAIDAEGGSSFRDLSVPTAVIRLRQGFGRLIRSTTDRGIVVLADPRITTKSYGRRFINSLPAPVQSFNSRETLLAHARNFLPCAVQTALNGN